MKQIVFILALFCFFDCAAQSLLPGDPYPDHPFACTSNGAAFRNGLKGASKKLYLLQFWSTSCPASIYQLEQLDSLQQLYEKELQILLVSSESLDSLDRFFAIRKKLKRPSLPFICNDAILAHSFPYRFYPFAVWINHDLTIAYITGGYNTTGENIAGFLRGNKPSLAPLQDTIVSGPVAYHLPRPLQRKMHFFSFLSGCTEGFNIGYEHGTEDSTSARITANCASVADLFKTAYEEGEKYRFAPKSKIIVEAGNPHRYKAPDDPGRLDGWEKENAYNYEIAVPVDRKEIIYRLMQQDLEQFFPLTAHIEERSIPCLALVRTGRKNKLQSKGGPPLNTLRLDHVLRPVNDPVRSLRNQPSAYLMTAFTGWIERATGLPFCDESGIKGKIDIDIRGDVYDSFQIASLNEELKKYDLAIVQKNCRQLVLVLKE